jgi:hypothetical protein
LEYAKKESAFFAAALEDPESLNNRSEKGIVLNDIRPPFEIKHHKVYSYINQFCAIDSANECELPAMPLETFNLEKNFKLEILPLFKEMEEDEGHELLETMCLADYLGLIKLAKFCSIYIASRTVSSKHDIRTIDQVFPALVRKVVTME